MKDAQCGHGRTDIEDSDGAVWIEFQVSLNKLEGPFDRKGLNINNSRLESCGLDRLDSRIECFLAACRQQNAVVAFKIERTTLNLKIQRHFF